MEGLVPLHLRRFSLRDVKAATANFGSRQAVGEGGFCQVFHGMTEGLGEVEVKRPFKVISSPPSPRWRFCPRPHCHTHCHTLPFYSTGTGRPPRHTRPRGTRSYLMPHACPLWRRARCMRAEGTPAALLTCTRSACSFWSSSVGARPSGWPDCACALVEAWDVWGEDIEHAQDHNRMSEGKEVAARWKKRRKVEREKVGIAHRYTHGNHTLS